jgi:hypothetical protein
VLCSSDAQRLGALSLASGCLFPRRRQQRRFELRGFLASLLELGRYFPGLSFRLRPSGLFSSCLFSSCGFCSGGRF